MFKSKSMRRVAVVSAATLFFGAATTAFVYEKGFIHPRTLTKSHIADVSRLESAIHEYKMKIEEMKVRKEELHRTVLKYQTTEKEQESKSTAQNHKYPAMKYGLPGEVDNDLFYYDKYIAKVDYQRRVPKWVLNSLDAESLRRRSGASGEITRERSVFGNDERDGVASQFRATNSDYFHSGYDRGHMVPAGDMKTSQRAMDETFYLNQNIVPQNSKNNRGYWRRFEAFVRDLAFEYKQVHVVSGPLYLPADYDKYMEKGRNEFGESTPVKRKMNYDVIGDNQVHVPTHLFKVVLAERDPKSVKSGESPLALSAFLLPNQPISSNVELESFEVPIEELEKRAGMHFFAKARQTTDAQELRQLTTVCLTSKTRCRMKAEDPSLDFIDDIRECKSEEQVQAVWQGMISQGIKPHPWTKQAYDDRMESIKRYKQRQEEQQQAQNL